MRLLLALLLLLAPLQAIADEYGFAPHLGARLPLDAPLRDEAGHATTLGAVAAGRPLVLALGYFKCPTLCGVVRDDALSALDHAGLRPGADYRLLVLSIDPAETPDDAGTARQAALDRYPDPGSAWRFLTAPEPSIAAIATAIGFPFRYDDKLAQFLHPAGIAFVTPSGTVSSYLLGVGYQPSDVRSAVLRAGQGAIANAVSPILLLCFHFDPVTGTYDFAVFRALSVMAGLTLLTMLLVFLALQRRRA